MAAKVGINDWVKTATLSVNSTEPTHNVELMSTIVAELVEMGKGDRWICNHIGTSGCSTKILQCNGPVMT